MSMVGIIGYGNMGGAFCRGLKAKGMPFAVSEKKEDRIDALKRDQGQESLAIKDLAARCDLLILAVKPQEAPALLAELKPLAAGKRFISIIAGKPLSFFAAALGTGRLCRFMPNLAALAGKAAVGVSFAEGADDTFRAEAFAFLHALALGGVACGIKYDDALRIAMATVEGAAASVRATGSHPVALISQVISPAGTTIKGIQRLESEGFTGAVIKAVEDAAKRAAELEK
jgi:pyrroline-5-carboxylate reductase